MEKTLDQRILKFPFSIRLAFAWWAILLIAVTARIAIVPPGTHSVVPVYLYAAERWNYGENIYVPAPGQDVYLYGPSLAAFFSHTSPVPLKAIEIGWRWLSVAVLLLGFRKLTIITGLTPRQSGFAFATLAVLSVPCVNNGQPNVLIAGLLTWGFAALFERKPVVASILLALATTIKLYPIAALLMILVARPRWMPVAILALVISLALPFLFQSPGYVWEQYTQLLIAVAAEDRTTATALARVPHDWTILVRLWFGMLVPVSMARIVSVLVGLAFAVCVWKAPDDRRTVLAFLLVSIWMTLLGPSTEIPTYMLLAPAAVWWVVRRPSVLALMACSLLVFPILRGMFPPSEFLMARTAAPSGAVLLMIDFLISVYRPEAQRAKSIVVFSRRFVAQRLGSTARVSEEKSRKDARVPQAESRRTLIVPIAESIDERG